MRVLAPVEQGRASAGAGARYETAQTTTLRPRERARLTASRERRDLRGEVLQDAGYPKGGGALGACRGVQCSHWLTLAGTYPSSGPLLAQ